MNDQTTWMIGWYVLLLGLPLMVMTVIAKDWLAHVHGHQALVKRRHKRGA